MFDLRIGLPFTGEELDEMINQVNKIRKRINGTKEEDPAEIAAKINLYVDLQAVVGELYAQAVHEKTEAYFERKRAYHAAIESIFGIDTETGKKAEAEKRTLAELKEEGQSKARAERWEQMFKNCEHKANSLKKLLEIRMAEIYGPQGARR